MSDMAWNKFSDEALAERYGLMAERIRGILDECCVSEKYKDYFTGMSEFLLYTIWIYEKKQSGILSERTLEECQEDQQRLYRSILPENYDASYANPAYAVKQFGEDAGQLLSFFVFRTGGLHRVCF